MKYKITRKGTTETDIVEAQDKQDLLEKWDVSEEYFDIEEVSEEKAS